MHVSAVADFCFYPFSILFIKIFVDEKIYYNKFGKLKINKINEMKKKEVLWKREK